MRKTTGTVRNTAVIIRDWKPSFIGLLFLVLFLCMSLLPSLLPRPWWLQGVVSGLAMGIGYGAGVGTSALYRFFVERELSTKYKQYSWQIARIALPICVVAFALLGLHWQNDVHHLLGTPEISPLYGVFAGGLALIVCMGCIWIARKIRLLGRKINSYLQQRVPPRLALGLAIALTTFIVYFIASGVLAETFYRVADSSFGARDNTAPAGITQPTSANRSGSPASLISWDKVGYQGRGFVGSGPSARDIEKFSQQPAKEPIRVYAGLASADTAEGRATLAVAELKRTHAFDRKVLIIATATGTGWLDPSAIDSAEYIYNGDTAIVSQQYSYLPSWISFLVDKQRARDAGRALYDAVIEEWDALPQDQRPKLLVYGLSLGSFGGQEAFSGINDIRRSVDGAIFTGTPNPGTIWRKTTNNRDAGTPEWQPTYQKGRSVRFASTREDILRNDDEWNDPKRILFQQHANDPVVWFDGSLLFHKPDWLKEQRAPTVSGATRWFPIVTFLQVGLDQAIAGSAPIGQGHFYWDTSVYTWSSILKPDGWSMQKADALQRQITQAAIDDE